MKKKLRIKTFFLPFCLQRGRDKQAHLNKKEEIENVYLMKERKEEKKQL